MSFSGFHRLVFMLFATSLGVGEAAQQGDARPEADARAEGEKPPEQPRFGRDRLAGAFSVADTLVYSPKVARELGVKPEDRRAIVKAVDEASVRGTSLRARLMDAQTWVANGTAQQEVLDRARAAVDAMEAKKGEAVRSRLSRSQYRRLLGITVQRYGYRSLTMPEVAAAVELSDEQDDAIRTILAARESERSALIAQSLERIKPAEQRRYDHILKKELAHQPTSPEEQAFMIAWFKAKDDRLKLSEKFEDETDARLFKVLARYQQKRFRALVGEIIETEGPIAETSASKDEKPNEPR